MENFYFKNIKISCCDIESSVSETLKHVKSGKPNYICVTDSRNIVNAHRVSGELKESINDSFISLPDGRPLSIFAKMKGIKNIDRVAGPDFMEEIFNRTSGTGIRHFFLGDTDDIHNLIKKKISQNLNLNIAGFYSPGFDNWNNKTDEDIMEMINISKADIIWVSLGGGKQEIWMKNNFNKLNKGIMVGVGAAFRFYVGKIKRAPVIFQRLGFEWFFRLLQQPKSMFTRYATTLPFFVIYSFQEAFKKRIILNSK